MKIGPDISFVNGKKSSAIPVFDRGLGYGDGLFETILYLDKKLILEKEHLNRLCRDAERLQIVLDRETLENELAGFQEGIASFARKGIIKIIITRQYSGRGYGFDKKSASNRMLQFHAGLGYPKENYQGVRVCLCDYRLADNTKLAGIKHLNRLDQVILQTQIKKPFYQEGIVFGGHGEVVEASSSNIFMVKDNELLTPCLDKSGVQGVMRDYILGKVARSLKIKTRIVTLSLDQLLSADEIFVCNSVYGVWPVNAIHVKQYSRGPVTRQIQEQIDKLGYSAVYE